MKIILFKKNGKINFLNPSNDLLIDDIIKKEIPSGIDYNIIDVSRLPVKSPFLDALNIDLSIDIEKAKEITKDQLRIKRKPLLDDLDIEYMRAEETGSDKTEIINKKQELRDITIKVDECDTVEELKALIETI